MSYQVEVIGYAWSGHQATMQYSAADMPDVQAVERLAGDFESVTDYRIVRITSGGDWAYSWVKREVVRNWASEESADVYEAAQFAE